MAKKTKKTTGVTRHEAVANVQAAIEACRKTASNPECMSILSLDEYADKLVRIIGLIAIARHDEGEDTLDVALAGLTELRASLDIGHQALVDAGVVEAEG